MKPAENIRCEELARLKTYDAGRPGFQVLRVVRWNGGDPVIEKRWFYKMGESYRTGRVSGLSLQDVTLLTEKYYAIKELIEKGVEMEEDE